MAARIGGAASLLTTRRPPAGGDVQLHLARSPSAAGPPAPGDPAPGGRGAGRVVAAVRNLYSGIGRPSIPPEKLLRAQLLRVLYSVRSERQLMEQLDYTCSSAGSSGWIWTTPCGIRRRSPRITNACSMARKPRPSWSGGRAGPPPSTAHCLRPGPGSDDPGNPTVDFHGEQRSSETHASTIDPEACCPTRARCSAPSESSHVSCFVRRYSRGLR